MLVDMHMLFRTTDRQRGRGRPQTLTCRHAVAHTGVLAAGRQPQTDTSIEALLEHAVLDLFVDIGGRAGVLARLPYPGIDDGVRPQGNMRAVLVHRSWGGLALSVVVGPDCLVVGGTEIRRQQALALLQQSGDSLIPGGAFRQWVRQGVSCCQCVEGHAWVAEGMHVPLSNSGRFLVAFRVHPTTPCMNRWNSQVRLSTKLLWRFKGNGQEDGAREGWEVCVVS
jgi:hypothetical protein